MVEPNITMAVMIVFLIIFGILIPILDNTKTFSKFISQRWTIILVLLMLCIGAVLDFHHLDNGIRGYLIIGTLIISGMYILIRSVEKCLAKGWGFGGNVEARKGDLSLVLKEFGFHKMKKEDVDINDDKVNDKEANSEDKEN